MATHHLTPVQRRVLRFINESTQPVVFETGYKTTEFTGGFIIRCQSFVPFFLKHHGYIYEPNTFTGRYALTQKGVDIVSRMRK